MSPVNLSIKHSINFHFKAHIMWLIIGLLYVVNFSGLTIIYFIYQHTIFHHNYI